MTNADKIRGMTDEQLAKWFNEHDDQWYFCNNDCPYNNGVGCTERARSCLEGRLKWLRQEADNE